MNYLLHISLSCWLAITATAVIAAGSLDNQGAISDEPSPALPSVHFTVRAPAEASHQPVLIEGFWPLMQRQEQLLLLQGTWQRQHHLLSLGLGWRYFPETDWGVGYHLFYDQETTRQQRRLGLGAEVWLHSLTLTVNGYLPANGWWAARDLKGYRHCPASGYDVTLQGHLPALPYLGASLHYARYSGDTVTLGSGQQHYRNPQQWRWGIDLTPMPLLILAYHRHATPSARAKQQISVTLTYRFSLSLLQQLDPNQVAALYSALGQRLAPVQREQLMPLQYALLSNDKPFRQAGASLQVIEKEMEALRGYTSIQATDSQIEIAKLKRSLQAIERKMEELRRYATTQATDSQMKSARLKSLQAIARLNTDLQAINRQIENATATHATKIREREIANLMRQIQNTETAQRKIAELKQAKQSAPERLI